MSSNIFNIGLHIRLVTILLNANTILSFMMDSSLEMLKSCKMLFTEF